MSQPRWLYRYRRAKIRLITRLLDHYVRQVRRTHGLTVIAVTGTIGKTSAKMAIAELLATKHVLWVEPKNHNSDRAVRLTFFGLEFPNHSRWLLRWVPVLWRVHRRSQNFPYRYVVLELAESRQRSLQQFVAELQPEIGVVTAVSPVHLSYFSTYDRVIEAVWSLATACQTIVFNADFRDLVSYAERTDGPIMSYGLRSGDVRINGVRRTSKGLRAELQMPNADRQAIQTQLVARQSLYSVAAAAAVAHVLGWNPREIAASASNLQPVPGRMRPMKGINNALLLDDCFNASPMSMQAALETLASYPGKKIAVLGSMNELDQETRAAHAQVGRQVAQVADELIVIGEAARNYLAPAARRAGMASRRIHAFDRANQCGEVLRSLITPKSTVLFKGSQGNVYVEEAMKFVLADPLQADSELIRQHGSWRHRKRGFFTELGQQETSV